VWIQIKCLGAHDLGQSLKFFFYFCLISILTFGSQSTTPKKKQQHMKKHSSEIFNGEFF